MTMIYEAAPADAPLSQGDVIDGGTILFWTADPESPYDWYSESSTIRVVVPTQACDLAQGKSARVLVAPVHAASRLVRDGVLNARSVRDQQRVARIATPYREHMAQHFSNTYARIALPTSYETEREQT